MLFMKRLNSWFSAQGESDGTNGEKAECIFVLTITPWISSLIERSGVGIVSGAVVYCALSCSVTGSGVEGALDDAELE